MSITCKFYGGTTGAIFSKIWGRDIGITPTEFNNYNLTNYIPSWESDTYFLCDFDNSVDAGNIISDIGVMENLLVYREEVGSNILEYLNTLELNEVDFYDFKVVSGYVYRYHLYVKGSVSISNSISTDAIQSDYYGWFLVDINNNRAYHFDINFEGGDKIFIEDYTEHETNNLNNIFTRGGNFYIDGTLGTIISKDNLKTEIQYTNEDLLSLAEFVKSDRPKILKDRRGNIFRVLVYGYEEKVLNVAIGENIYSVSINFKEVGDV